MIKAAGESEAVRRRRVEQAEEPGKMLRQWSEGALG